MDDEAQRLIELLGTAHGYAVEVGAADGEFTSPTLALERAGWRCICIEPNPIYAAKCRSIRKWVVEAAAADFTSRDADFTVCNVDSECKVHEMQGGSALEVQRGHLGRMGWTPKGEYVIKVAVTTVHDCLLRANFPRLDFLSIDTEGTEDAVLRGSNIERWMPRVICVENWPGVNKSDHLLFPLGYKRIERVMGNYTDWYVL